LQFVDGEAAHRIRHSAFIDLKLASEAVRLHDVAAAQVGADVMVVQEQRKLVAHALTEVADRSFEQLVLDVRRQVTPGSHHTCAESMRQLLVSSLRHRRHGLFLSRSEKQ
jgi:hypothetical protein